MEIKEFVKVKTEICRCQDDCETCILYPMNTELKEDIGYCSELLWMYPEIAETVVLDWKAEHNIEDVEETGLPELFEVTYEQWDGLDRADYDDNISTMVEIDLKRHCFRAEVLFSDCTWKERCLIGRGKELTILNSTFGNAVCVNVDSYNYSYYSTPILKINRNAADREITRLITDAINIAFPDSVWPPYGARTNLELFMVELEKRLSEFDFRKITL